MNMLGLLPKITDDDWSFIHLWLIRAADYRRREEVLRHEFPLMNREYVKNAGEAWILHIEFSHPEGSIQVMKKLFD